MRADAGYRGARALGMALGGLLALTAAACGGSGPISGPESGETEASRDGGDRQELVVLEGLGGGSVVAADVNRSLQVTGTAETSDGVPHAFLWSNGELRDLGTLGGSWSRAADVNDWGQVTGTSVTDAGEARAFFWADGEMYQIGTLGGRESHGVAVNDRGQVAGFSTTANGEIHAFLWSHGEMRDLGTLGGSGSFSVAANDRGQVVGRSTTGEGAAHAFRWSGGELARLAPLESSSSSAVDLSGRGHVLVNSRAGSVGRAHLWTEGRLVTLGAPDGSTVVAAAVNARGEAVGQSSGPAGFPRAVLWRDGRPTPLHSEDYAASSTATAINRAGEVTGAVRPDGDGEHRAFLWAEGAMATLDPGRFGKAPERTAGVEVTASGAVLGLAHYASGSVGSFLWRPRTRSRPGREAVRRERPEPAARPGGNGADEAAVSRGASSPPSSSVAPLGASSPLGRALRRSVGEAPYPTLAWPVSVAALAASAPRRSGVSGRR